ncbi:hypothetical protein [Ferviditalea candida]|uniref:Uncharacterized protein n=1 Tax=Ferviditalea candida TaxID=3108399 RepID=A0ABU5ZKS8_9BACL|nr:hypothetical protein [Paenibacillaceae bacterium T2]
MQKYIVADGIIMEFHGVVPWNLPIKAYGRDWVVVEALGMDDALEQAKRFDTDQHPAQEIFAAAIRGMDEEEALKWVGWEKDSIIGYAEAAKILGWDKRRIGTYMQRGSFPEPIIRLASGPIWTRKQIEDYRDSRK